MAPTRQPSGGLFAPWRLPIHDDTGVARELLPMRALPSGTSRLDRLREKAYLVYGDLISFRRLMIRMAFVVVPASAVMPFLILWCRSIGLPMSFIVGLLVLVFGAVMLAWSARDFRLLAARAPEVADTYLDEGICPVCAYNLAGAVAAADQNASPLVRCAECGSAWSRSRVHRVDHDETAGAREAPSLRAILRGQEMLYAPMAGKDDAGAKIALARTSELRHMLVSATGEHRSRLEECVSHLRFQGWWKRALFASFVVPFCVFAMADVFTRPLSAIGFTHGLRLLGVVCWILGAVAILRSDIGRAGPERATFLKSRRICPACGALLPSAQGGEVAACTECGAAWKNADSSGENSPEESQSPPVEAR